MTTTSLVLGGSGIVGGHIVAQLVKAGEHPLALSRRPQPAQAGVTWVQGDLTEPETLRLPPVATIFCTAHSTYLAAALPVLASPALRRVVLFTSTSIETKLNSEIPAERDGLRRLADGERDTIAACERLGINWTVLRPTMIYCEGRDVNVTRLARLISRIGVMPLAGKGTGRRQPVHAEDLAIGALRAAASPAAANKTYVLPGPDIVTYREMVGRVFDGLQRPRRIVSVPPVLWRTAFKLAQPWFPHANVAMGDRMDKDMVFDATPAIADFGWQPREFRPRFDRV